MDKLRPIAIDAKLSSKLSNMSLLCAFFVVCMHTGGSGVCGRLSWVCVNLFQRGICLIAVPFFFACSGFLLAGKIGQGKSYWPQVKKRLLNLGVPYLLWNVSWMIVVLGFALFSGSATVHEIMLRVCTCGKPSSEPFLFNLPCGAWLTSIGLNPFGLPFVQQLWYVRSLLVLVAISPWLYRLANKKGLVAVWIAYLLIYPWGGGADHPFRAMFLGKPASFFRIMLSMEGVFYFTLGMFLRRYPINVSKRTISMALGVGLALLIAYIVCAHYQVAFGGKYFRMMSLPLVMAVVWCWISDKALPKRISSLAFPIYLLHRCVLWGFGVLHLPFGRGYLMLIVKCIVVFVVSGICAECFRRALPRISNFYFGGR